MPERFAFVWFLPCSSLSRPLWRWLLLSLLPSLSDSTTPSYVLLRSHEPYDVASASLNLNAKLRHISSALNGAEPGTATLQYSVELAVSSSSQFLLLSPSTRYTTHSSLMLFLNHATSTYDHESQI
eukprot:4471925-Pleurochrysis_carterae.AAC.2